MQVEEIEIPLTSGSLDSIVDGEAAGMDDESERPESSVAVDSLDTQNAAAIYAREAEIAVDFSGLDEDLCSLESSDDIADVDKQFRDKLASMQTQLESMRPNLSAAKKLASLADALTESKAKFEEVQAESKRIAAEFAKVQQERADLFSLAFEHVKSVIDPIYKQLTTAKKRAKGGSQGGAAFIGMENSEEPYVHANSSFLGSYSSVRPLAQVRWRGEVQCHATAQALPRDGPAIRRGEDSGCSCALVCGTLVPRSSFLRAG